MKSADQVGITFANLCLGRGILNGVVNVTLGAFAFTPEGDKVEADPMITARLRLDVPCAIALRDALTALLNDVQVKPSESPAAIEVEVAPNGVGKH